ncbi:hypothetical protein V7S43_000454 [Phytophthora oleae]|uniref:Uncharacterized protein n=1 Tax=Phytophthora oleae TaxID=2107226 RepID=A0ABD3G7D9_9STRA
MADADRADEHREYPLDPRSLTPHRINRIRSPLVAAFCRASLVADPKRELISDDDHDWDDEGVFNLEGDCYAKTIEMSKKNNPGIFNAIRLSVMLENVWIDANNEPDYFNSSTTKTAVCRTRSTTFRTTCRTRAVTTQTP